MKPPTEISRDQAQLLMSQLLDGELTSSDAQALEAYLTEHPDEQDWMENVDTLRDLQSQTTASPGRSTSISSIHEAIAADESPPRKPGALLSFPNLLRPMAAAAAIAIVGSATWLGLREEPQPVFEPNIVEFVSTDIPDSSTYIIPDEETGWTVVWVDSSTPLADPSQG